MMLVQFSISIDHPIEHTEHYDSPNQLDAWVLLQQHAQAISSQRMSDWFAQDASRAGDFTFTGAGIRADFAKQKIDRDVMTALLALAEQRDMGSSIADMFAGARLNSTEDRAVLHVALRGSVAKDLEVQDANVSRQVHQQLEKMLSIADKINDGDWRGFSGRKIRDVVHIGIGGSDLGPRMVHRALTPCHRKNVKLHFVSNLDAHEILHTLAELDAETTLFLVASKSFRTEETLNNANIAKRWLIAELGDEKAVLKHMLAMSASASAVADFGIDPEHRLEFWDWVGGRFSLWSVIGLPLAIALGREQFVALLNGAQAMDKHFLNTELDKNLPVLMGLVALWNRVFLGYATQAIIPYYHFLDLLPAYLQQAEMESNGKSVLHSGAAIESSSSAVIWGSAGTDCQHAYFQMLHQGTDPVPVDFIAVRQPYHTESRSHVNLLAHAIAQGEALLTGFSADSTDDLAAHRYCPGDRPSTNLLLEVVDAYNMGALIALYEHKTFVLGQLLGINSFDQFGVELGKLLAADVQQILHGGEASQSKDASTLELIAAVRSPVQKK